MRSPRDAAAVMDPAIPGRSGLRIRLRGAVQGVGFRPFVYRTATAMGLTGWVRNTSGVVEIEVEGPPAVLDRFIAELRDHPPGLARVRDLDTRPIPLSDHAEFRIRPSAAGSGWQEVSPDVATCDACLEELFDPDDRRWRYPFINCTQCGPRFTIITRLPYDRPNTTMRRFVMCEACRREYDDPADRRFHAQPVACPQCGPRLWLAAAADAGELVHAPTDPRPVSGDAIVDAVDRLRAGRILALKGLGGFQLACDAASASAVSTLRERKHRWGKAFAVMVAGVAEARALCRVGAEEEAVLTGPRRPIVVLARKEGVALAEGVAPGLHTLGIMLPYTPLHHLLLRRFGGPLVMTSGNLSEEPIAVDNAEAVARLADIADDFLLHDRDIHARYDDSVVLRLGGATVPLRRARGFAPEPVSLPFRVRDAVLACGAQQKSTFCLLKERSAFLSQHIGDLDDLETLGHFEASLALYRRLFDVEPALVAHDLHPDYMSTRFALEYPGRVPPIGVQHHHAHVVSCMAEHGVRDPVIGVAYDGTGYGPDGAIWGGEVLVADWAGFRRHAHLAYVPLLGGESAVRHPARMTASYLWTRGAPPEAAEDRYRAFFDRFEPDELRLLRWQHRHRVNAPPTSSCGRLFDAAAALLGVRTEAEYEGQPAMELEARADPAAGESYSFGLEEREDGSLTIDPVPAFAEMWSALQAGADVAEIAGRFHGTVTAFTLEACRHARRATGIESVCLSGGCFQNVLLTDRTAAALRRDGFAVYLHRIVPPNDGGIAFGQAVAACARSGRLDG